MSLFNIFRRKSKDFSRTIPGFEETERKTSKTGIILLMAMFVAGIYFGWQALGDLAAIPNPPEPLSSCSYSYQDSGLSFSLKKYRETRRGVYIPYEHDYSNSTYCKFSEIEKIHNIPELFKKRIPLEEELKILYNNLSDISNSLSQTRNSLEQLTKRYGVGLQEREVEIEKPIFPTAPTQKSITSLQQEEARLLKQKTDLEKQQIPLQEKIKVIDEQLKEAYRPIFKKQNWLLHWYEFKVFLLQFIFIIPLFFFIFWGYLRLHRKDSPYTIIFTAMIAVASILLLRIILYWFWGLFLARILEVLLEWFMNYQIIKTLLFYFGMILSFVIFGGAVYYLQKKIFNPKRVILRRLRAKQCPHCQTDLDLSGIYCPNCSFQLKEKCEKCGQIRFIDLPACPHCGNKK